MIEGMNDRDYDLDYNVQKLSETIVHELLTNLEGRKGFKQILANMDEEIHSEIIEELITSLKPILKDWL